jgi:hypothetical protein
VALCGVNFRTTMVGLSTWIAPTWVTRPPSTPATKYTAPDGSPVAVEGTTVVTGCGGVALRGVDFYGPAGDDLITSPTRVHVSIPGEPSMTWWSIGAWFVACMEVLAFPARAVEYRLQVANVDCLDRAGVFGAARDTPAVHEHAGAS